jgi:hypothetical protein
MGERTTVRIVWELAAMAALGATALSLGCSSGSNGHPPVSSLHEGLNVFEARSDWGMNAAYVKNGAVVYVETRIGPETPEMLRIADPDTPLHEVDVRYVDELGNTFSGQRGGDEFIDPAWAADMKNVTAVSGEHRDQAFLLAREAGLAVQSSLGAEMQEHVRAAVAVGNHVPAEDPLLIAKAATFRATQGAYTSYTHYAELYKKCVAGCLGEHSAVYAAEWTGSSYDWTLNTCNHGTCALSMSYTCYTGRAGRTNHESGYFTGEMSQSTGTVSGACSTGYNWNPNPGQHNSNDDAWYELWQVANNQQGSRSSTGGNDSCGYSYSCNGTGTGDFSAPCCL